MLFESMKKKFEKENQKKYIAFCLRQKDIKKKGVYYESRT